MSHPTPDAILAPFRVYHDGRRGCDHQGCTAEGLYRAPLSRDRLTDYLWFCLDHVRLYNSAWDYFKGMSESEIEAHRRKDTVWQRPTWPLSNGWHRAEAMAEERLREAYGFAGSDTRRSGEPARQRTERERALEVFDLGVSVTFTEVKACYKRLVKRLHPDANGGDKQAEERLKVVNQAYATLKKAYSRERPR